MRGRVMKHNQCVTKIKTLKTLKLILKCLFMTHLTLYQVLIKHELNFKQNFRRKTPTALNIFFG